MTAMDRLGANHPTTCPLCHTAGPALDDECVLPGVGWRCSVCGQAWDLTRLATVAAYTAYSGERTSRALGHSPTADGVAPATIGGL